MHSLICLANSEYSKIAKSGPPIKTFIMLLSVYTPTPCESAHETFIAMVPSQSHMQRMEEDELNGSENIFDI